MDDLTQRKEEELGSSKKRLEIPLSLKVLRVFSFCIFLLLFLLLGRSFQLQFLEGDHYSALARRNIVSVSNENISRGVIYDRYGEQLVYNLPEYNLYFRFSAASSPEKDTVKEVAEIIKEDPGELMDRIKNKEDSASVLVKRDISHDSLVRLQSRIEDLPGFHISGGSGRDYKYGRGLSHILGYIGKIDKDTLSRNPERYAMHDYVGKMGVEEYYEEYLSMGKEERLTKRDVSGNVRSEEELGEPSDGTGNLVLTIDARLQKIVNEKMDKKIEEIGGEKASVVAIDPRNGEVMAMANRPTFDNNLFRTGNREEIEDLLYGESEVFLNRITSSTYATGSVIKPLLAVAALEEGIIDPQKEIHSPGYISIQNPWNPSQPTIFRDYQAHGWRDMREAIAVSSNVYFYAIGGGYEDQEGLGVSRIKDYLSLFGWNERTGIDLPTERSGFIPTPEWKRKELGSPWYLGDTYNLSIGQGYLSTTPLQVANAYTAIVNGGNLYSPRLGKKVIDEESNTIKKMESELIREGVASEENLEIVREGMLEATKIGTARSLQALPFDSGAKTGTAQTSREGINNNWVTVFAPYDDPEIVVTVLIEEVRGVTPVATHLARDILLEYFNENE